MMTRRTPLVIAAVLSLCSAAMAQDPKPVPNGGSEPQNSASGPKFPKFIMDALHSPHVLRGKIYVARDGTIERAKVFVRREGLPEWTHQIADDKLGKGQEVAYEVEVYGDGTEVYEIARLIEGRPKKISLRRDQKVRYVEQLFDKGSLPAAVAATLGKIEGFQVGEVRRREGDKLTEYHIVGLIAGVPHRAMIRADGTLQSVTRHLPAEMEVAITTTEPAAK